MVSMLAGPVPLLGVYRSVILPDCSKSMNVDAILTRLMAILMIVRYFI